MDKIVQLFVVLSETCLMKCSAQETVACREPFLSHMFSFCTALCLTGDVALYIRIPSSLTTSQNQFRLNQYAPSTQLRMQWFSLSIPSVYSEIFTVQIWESLLNHGREACPGYVGCQREC